jgi:hypothetical protein
MVKHVMCRRAHGSTSMIIPRRPGRRGNVIVTCPAARLAGLAWLAGAARLAAAAAAAAAAPLPLKVGLHANAFLLSSEMGGKRAKKLVYEVVQCTFYP